MDTSGWVWFREADDAHTRDDNARFRAVLGHCPKCIAVLDENGNLVGYNKEFRALFSTPPAIGGPVAQLFDERPRAMLDEVVARAGTQQRAGAVISMQTTVGEEHEFEFLVATLPGDGTRTIGVVMAADDRTDRIHEEGERSLLALDIGDANCHRAINFAQLALCHDINNVFTTLSFTLAALQERCGTADSEICTMLDEFDEAVRHGSEIVARAKSHSQVSFAHRGTTDVRDCVGQAARIVAQLARSAKVTLAIRVLSEARVPLSGTELTQVLTNLLTNSVHAIQDARRPGRIDITVECATRETVILCVRDDGVGIEPTRLVDSFEAFQTTRAARGGTGLGLAIAREIVEAAGGHIDVLSTPGCATEMRLELPTASDASEADAAVEGTS
jgi:PAS domain S-box-containing protein